VTFTAALRKLQLTCPAHDNCHGDPRCPQFLPSYGPWTRGKNDKTTL